MEILKHMMIKISMVKEKSVEFLVAREACVVVAIQSTKI